MPFPSPFPFPFGSQCENLQALPLSHLPSFQNEQISLCLYGHFLRSLHSPVSSCFLHFFVYPLDDSVPSDGFDRLDECDADDGDLKLDEPEEDADLADLGLVTL